MKLLESYDELFFKLRPFFERVETFERARALAYAHLITFGRHTISRIICAQNKQHQDWSAEYKFFSQRKWDAFDLNFEILQECDRHCYWYQNAMLLVMDESLIKKTGKKIPQVRTLRDPMSLSYHTNLTPAIRFLQVSAVVNPENHIEAYRAIPIFLKEAAPAKKPKKNAPEPIKEQYKKEQQEKRLSVVAHKALILLRQQIDNLQNGNNRLLFISVDGSFCNRFFLRNVPDKTIVIARTRKNIKIFRPAENAKSTPRGGRYRIYGERLPTPDEIRKDNSIPWKTVQIYATGKYHKLKYKVVNNVLWPTGTGSLPGRLFIIAPLRYRKSKNSKLLYRNPAYLWVLDNEIPEDVILQYYFPRWDIEVNHRDEKSLLGLGDAQVRSEESVERNPQFSALVYSMLLLASINAYGPFRTDDYLPAPKWDKKKDQEERRPSTLDVLSQFRREIMMAQLQSDLEQDIKNLRKNKKNRHKPSSRIRARKMGFINDEKAETKPLKLPVNILSAILYADS